MYGMFYIDPYYIYLVLPAIIISVFCSINVNATFNRYKKYNNSRGLTGASVARMILDSYNLNNVDVQYVSGKLTDHYDPRQNVIRLSESVYNSTSIASIGVAAHEVGHAIQYSQKYLPIKLRASIIPVTQIGSQLSIPLVIFGFFADKPSLVLIGILLFSTVAIFQLITLPVEFNASRRAISIIEDKNILNDEELKGAKKVLAAAALTYVAALVVSLANLLRIILIYGRRRNE